ncbi:MAG: multidrug effflux MFS transporter [Actinomycetia bacterium]|nr:multidrug effflux MFS transporter [Actinomycetes bacterium]
MPSNSSTVRSRNTSSVIAYLALSGSLLALGIDIVIPAFDEMRPDLGLAPESTRVSLIVTVYFVGMAIGQPIWGPISDRFGRRPSMVAGLVLYIVGAGISAASTSLPPMLVARFIWGFGAAAPALLRMAIARDLYQGDQMARVMSIVMAVFMIGPVAAPLVGALILLIAPWQAVFVFCMVAAAGQILWVRRFGETLPDENRRPLQFKPTAKAFRRVLTTRSTMAVTLALTLNYAGFFIFLGSSQPIMDRLYGRDDLFVAMFSGAGVVMAAAFVVGDRLIGRRGAAATLRGSAVLFCVLSLINLFVTVAYDGLPALWIWIVGFVALNTVAAPFGPACFSLALQPMGDLAGTASGIVGLITTAVGSVLAAIVDARIESTVTPMAVAYLLFGLAALVMVWVGTDSRLEGDPVPVD